ncbi:TonB-dependent receptor [Mucilaginibacter robiniae]|uniref:TonB-dependent receptor n=1 Tax=Mucilaginibacter robiniae TaxID=2728022 RepID=A0A7L5E089_9SPHI|nr:TonB-dependent receptor [Mucilaginibacter robiniae]QJD96645.1 TonB-dependent receptor [Mucilaginibacter robiniae]
MIRKIIIIFLLALQSATAQQKLLKVLGDVTDTAGVGVVNCTVTLFGANDGLIYSHFNIGNNNTFKVEIDFGRNDSLVVEVHHLAFTPFRRVYAVVPGTTTLRLSATLHSAVRNLKEVNITPPRIWKRGDTTFYKANQFKEGDEKKLKDLLLKLPDFRLETDGQITYKNKPLDKITIDGEELFSDKIELLLSNFPVHVLNTIQVIENQSSQRLLKGLAGENKTFINLQVDKKNRLSAGFGEVEAGVGNRDRYNLSPVAFSIYSQIKAGFVGNYNSIGNGIGLQQEGELRGLPERDAQQLLMSNHTLYHINNFEQRWYIQNRQWDNRLQINTPVSKTIHSQTEISYIRDRQPQHAYYTSFLLNNGRYEQRIDSNSNLYKPAILSVKQTFNIQPDSVHDLKVVFDLYDDRSLGQQTTIFRGFGIGSPLAVATQNQWTSLTLSSDYTIRQTLRKASTISFLVNKQNLGQSASGESADIAGIFSLPAGYNEMSNRIQTSFLNIQGSWKLLLRDKKNHLTNFGLSLQHKAIGLNQRLNIDQHNGNLSLVEQSGLSNLFDYSVTKFTSSFMRSFRAIFKDPFFFTTELGVAHFSPGNKDSVSAFSTFLFKSTLSQDHTLAEGLTGKFSGGVSQWQLEPEHLYSGYYPSTILSFRRSLNLALPLRKLEGTYVVGYRLPNDLTYFAFLISGEFMPNGIVTYNTYNSFIGFADAYLLNKSTSRKTVSFSMSMPSLLLNAMINFNALYQKSGFLISSGSEIWNTSLDYYSLFLSLKKNWNRKYYIRLSTILSTNINHLPSSTDVAESKISSLKHNFYQRLLINKQMNLVSNFNYYQNNLFTTNRANFLMADVEWNYQWKQSPLYLSLKADNLFNEKNYYSYNNSVLVQSFSTIPLIGRSIYASVRYTF